MMSYMSRFESIVYTLARTPGGDANPQNFKTRANQFVTLTAECDSATLLVHRNADGMYGYFIAAGPDDAVRRAATAFAQAVGARAEKSELPDSIAEECAIAAAKYSNGDSVARSPMVGVDPTEASRRMEVALSVGDWVALSIRKRNKKEGTRNQAWLAHRLSTEVPNHHSMSTDATVISIFTGSSSYDQARTLVELTRAALQGFDLTTESVRVSPAAAARPFFAVAALAAIGVVGLVVTGSDAWPVSLNSAVTWSMALVAVGVLMLAGLGAGLARLTGVWRSTYHQVREGLAGGQFPAPPTRNSKPKAPVREGTDKKGKRIKARSGDYPLHSRSFLLSPEVFVGVVAPYAGAISGEAASRHRTVPPRMTQRIGPLVGDVDGTPVHLSAADAYSGVALLGRAGSGKAQPLDSRFPVPASPRFPTGWAANGDLVAGDLVYAPDGTTTKVRDFSDVFTTPTYTLTFDDGSTAVAAGDHLWRTSTRYSRTTDTDTAAPTSKTAAALSKRDAARVAEVARVRDLAASIEPGTSARVPDIAALLGIGTNAVLANAEKMGLDRILERVAIREGGPVKSLITRRLYAIEAVIETLAPMASGHRSNVTTEGVDRLRDLAASGTCRVSIAEAADALLGRASTRAEHNSMRTRLRNIGEHSIVESSWQLIDSAPVTREAVAYPLAEYLTCYADLIDTRKPRAPITSLVTTAEMAENLRVHRTRAANHAVEVAAPINVGGPARRFPVDPYVLGAWLGDGNSRRAEFTCDPTRGRPRVPVVTDESGEPVEPKRESGQARRLPGDQHHLAVQIAGAGHQVKRMPRKPSTIYVPDLFAPLRAIGVLGRKHVPSIYARANAAQRLALLQGLMDTEGSVNAEGGCEIALADRRLATDTLDLVRSLGIKASVSWDQPMTHRGVDGVLTRGRDRHRIHFTTTTPVFRLPRKVDRLPDSVRSTQRWRYVIKIEVGAPVPMRCITVSHPSGMYLTDSFTATHNSVSTRSMFGWACMERKAPSGLEGAPGEPNTLIAFESKGDGVTHYQSWASATGIPLVVVDLADPSTLAIDLFGSTGSVYERAERFVNGLVYAFADGSIQDRAFAVLQRIYTAALVISENPEIAAAAGAEPDRSTNYYANVLIGNASDAQAVALASEILARAKRPDTRTPDIALAAEGLSGLFENKTESARRNLVESSQNKISQLHSIDQWWSPTRRKVTWEQILSSHPDKHRAVVINTGPSIVGNQVADKLTAIMSALLMYTLQISIRNNCSEWQSKGRSVSIYADELSLLTGSSEEVILWLKDQGRSFGVRPVLATQRPEQLPPKVRKLVLNFGTLICFNQEDRDTAVEVANQLSGSEGEVTAEEIMHLPRYQAMVRSYVNGSRQSPFTTAMANFEADRPGAVAAQGYAEGIQTAGLPQVGGGESTNQPVTAPAAPVMPDFIPPVFTNPVAAPADEDYYYDDEPVTELPR